MVPETGDGACDTHHAARARPAGAIRNERMNCIRDPFLARNPDPPVLAGEGS
jgi:hypothetical protein